MTKKRLLAVSNGHGEDDIAGKVIEALTAMLPGLRVEAWPMVGDGAGYRARGVPVSGPSNRLPSEGFGTLSGTSFLNDLRHGFISTHWRQLRHARALRGRYDMLLGVGDVMPLLVARLSQTQMAFIACAKSAHYALPDGHNNLERRLMRRYCPLVFARDALTARGLSGRGVACEWLGNPMMDGLDIDEGAPPVNDAETAVLMLAGSRRDAADNGLLLLDAAARLADRHPDPARLAFLFPLHASLPVTALAESPGWHARKGADGLTLEHGSGARAQLRHGGLGGMARRASVAVGLAGTANEQAIGLGLPLITLPGAGNQGPAYVRMKMHYFGESALAVARDAGQVAAAIEALLGDPERRARMARAGRDRMGAPGASAAIAARLVAHIEARA